MLGLWIVRIKIAGEGWITSDIAGVQYNIKTAGFFAFGIVGSLIRLRDASSLPSGAHWEPWTSFVTSHCPAPDSKSQRQYVSVARPRSHPGTVIAMEDQQQSIDLTAEFTIAHSGKLLC